MVPDLKLNKYSDLTADYLLGIGVSALILDIDNTLVPYEIPEPTAENLAWLTLMHENGIKTAFVSNNHKERVELYNQSLGCPAFPDSGKPFKKACKRALEAMEIAPSEAAIIGDQVFTDVLCGRNAKLKLAILVKPIKDKTNLFFMMVLRKNKYRIICFKFSCFMYLS